MSATSPPLLLLKRPRRARVAAEAIMRSPIVGRRFLAVCRGSWRRRLASGGSRVLNNGLANWPPGHRATHGHPWPPFYSQVAHCYALVKNLHAGIAQGLPAAFPGRLNRN